MFRGLSAIEPGPNAVISDKLNTQTHLEVANRSDMRRMGIDPLGEATVPLPLPRALIHVSRKVFVYMLLQRERF